MHHAEKNDPGGPAELVLSGGTVLCLDEADRRAEALAIRYGRIVRIGSTHDVAPLIGRRTRVVELHGRAVIPGINDSHLHATWLGAQWPATVFDAMEGSTATPAPLLTTASDRRAAILRAGQLVASLGITSYTEPGLGPGEDSGATGCFGQNVFDEYVALEAERLLTARVNVLMLFGELDGPSSLQSFASGLRVASRETRRPSWLRVAGVKIFADGIPPMQHAWTRQQYPDGTSGSLLVDGTTINESESHLRQMIEIAHGLGHQVGVHATGDRTIQTVVDAFSEAMNAMPSDLRHYIIHGDLVQPETLAVMARHGVGLNLQAQIATKTSSWIAGVLGEETAAKAWPIAAAMAAGVDLSLSSDAPVLSPDWRLGIVAADEWMGAASDPAQRVRELLRAYTVMPARQDRAELWKGTLEVGKVGDLCVLGADPTVLTAADMPEVSIDLTVVDGEIVFERDST